LSPSPDLSVVVVAYGPADALSGALDALGGIYPVVVVDNASSSEGRRAAHAAGAMYVDPGKNLGFASGVNLALARRPDPRGDVLLLNPDARIDASELERLRAALSADESLAAVAPALRAPGSDEPSRTTWPWHTPGASWAEAVGMARRRLRSSPYFLGGAVVLLRGAALVDVGPFDERFFLYNEEEDWQRRALARGWRVRYCPEVTALHAAGGTDRDPDRHRLRLHAAIERYVRKWYGPFGWTVYRAGMVVGQGLRAAVRRGLARRGAARLAVLYLRGPDRTARRAGAVPAPR
jgi:GT2 family glycosyltransferase